MKTTAMKMALGSWAACLALGAFAADPEIGGVMIQQRWPWSRLVDIDYVLTCDATQTVDVAVSGYNGTTALTFPLFSLTGDLYGLSSGAHRIIWDPTVTAYTNAGVLGKFRVALTPSPVPVYMIVDLTKSAGADGQIEYIYPGDARLETYGRFTNVWFGVTNDSVYATDKLVLRRVHAGTFGMGASANISTVLTKDFYAGVFEVTESQWKKIMGGSSALTVPICSVSYDDIRGSTNADPVINWYATGSTVSSTNFIGRLRSQTGLSGFDLPTEAQWEYLCRAGTKSYYNDGESTSQNDTNILSRLAWWKGDSGSVSHAVGGKEPNGWGLYDTHGNAWEWCRDWAGGSLGGTDPRGPSSGTKRMLRGGSFTVNNDAVMAASSYRLDWFGTPSIHDLTFGFRIMLGL